MNLQGRFYIRRAGLAAHTKRYRVSFQLGVEPWSCLDVMSLYFTYSTYLRGDKVQLSAGKLLFSQCCIVLCYLCIYSAATAHIKGHLYQFFTSKSVYRAWRVLIHNGKKVFVFPKEAEPCLINFLKWCHSSQCQLGLKTTS